MTDVLAGDCGGGGIGLDTSSDITISGLETVGCVEGIWLSDSDDNAIFDVRAALCDGDGVWIGDDSTGNTIVGVVSYNNGDDGFELENFHGNTAVALITTNNGEDGIWLDNANGNTLAFITSTNNNLAGIDIGYAWDNTLSQALVINNTGGLWMPGGGNNQIASLVATNNEDESVWLGETTEGNSFANLLLVGQTECYTDGTSPNPGLIDGSCTGSGVDGSNDYPGQASSAVLRINKDLTSTFVGKITSDDTANPVDDHGAIDWGDVYDFDPWLELENQYRTVARDGGDFPDSTHRGRCYEETCRIWDWRVLGGETMIFNRSGDGMSENEPFAEASLCPAAVRGDVALFDDLGNVFLINAIELPDTGGDDGLCESDEVCVYAPSFGAYLGEGDLVGPCNFQDGAVSRVTMLGFSVLGP